MHNSKRQNNMVTSNTNEISIISTQEHESELSIHIYDSLHEIIVDPWTHQQRNQREKMSHVIKNSSSKA